MKNNIKEEIEKRYEIARKRRENILARLNTKKRGTKAFEIQEQKFIENEKELFNLYALKEYVKNQLDKDIEKIHY